ncbi:uncharacterized protein [Amphiura filiformis]|uniref:uncharacterized protein n=1 Tax=Amphiura filiformis TaxID=82378 RepID=UPI003B218672
MSPAESTIGEGVTEPESTTSVSPAESTIEEGVTEPESTTSVSPTESTIGEEVTQPQSATPVSNTEELTTPQFSTPDSPVESTTGQKLPQPESTTPVSPTESTAGKEVTRSESITDTTAAAPTTLEVTEELRITPRSLKLKCPIKTNRAREIIEKAQHQLLRERIRVTNNRINGFKQQKSRLENDISSRVTDDIKNQVTDHVTRKTENTFQKTKWRHTQKLDRLIEKSRSPNSNRRNTAENPELGGEQLKKWVVNLSKFELTQPQKSVLAKGLNFAPSPTVLPHEEYIVATELACRKLPSNEAAVLRSEMAGVLRSAKTPKQNITKEERQAIHELRKEKSIIVLPADKGKATVVMQADEYEQKLQGMLSDEKTYEQLDRDPTPRYKRQLVGILSRLKKEEKITKSQYDHLFPTAENVPRIYGTPKIHKEGNKVRPIVDYTGSISYNTSRALADILAPLVGQTEHHVKNSKQLAEDLAQGQDLQTIVWRSYGQPVSPITANLYMEFLEEQAIATAPLNCKPRLWKRYVEDILEIVKDNQVDNLTHHLNNTDPTDSIKFTYEKEVDGRIPFLDTLIVRKEDGSVKLLVYRKATHTDQYLNFRSHHPIYHKLGVVRTLLDRMDKIVTETEDRQKEEDNIKKALKTCGYPEWTIETVKKKIRDKPLKATKNKTKYTSQQTKGLVVIPYVEGVAERANRVFKKHNIATAMKPNTSLRKLLVHPKDKIDPLDKTDCIYEIPCKNCYCTYVGETGRKLNTRLKEHQKETEKVERGKKNFTRQTRKESVTEQSKSAIADHAIQQNHVINWDDTKVLQKECDASTRFIRESIWIRKRGPAVMNRDEGPTI